MRPRGHHERRQGPARAPARGAAGQHRQGARGPAGRHRAARGARYPAPEQSGPPVHADRARRRRRGHEPLVHRAAAVPRRGAADARGDLYL